MLVFRLRIPSIKNYTYKYYMSLMILKSNIIYNIKNTYETNVYYTYETNVYYTYETNVTSIIIVFDKESRLKLQIRQCMCKCSLTKKNAS